MYVRWSGVSGFRGEGSLRRSGFPPRNSKSVLCNRLLHRGSVIEGIPQAMRAYHNVSIIGTWYRGLNT